MKATVLAFVVAAMAVIGSASVQAGVVLSNMGATGLNDTSGPTNTDILASNWIGASFTTGATAQQLDWVSIVGFNNDVGNKQVFLYADIGGSPGPRIANTIGTAVSGKNVYQFNFVGPRLSAATTYWILPEAGLSWYMESTLAAPTAQNASGFSYNGVKTSTDSGSSWNTSPFHYTIGISTSDAPPVPEPAITSLVCLGGIAFMRRRMKK